MHTIIIGFVQLNTVTLYVYNQLLHRVKNVQTSLCIVLRTFRHHYIVLRTFSGHLLCSKLMAEFSRSWSGIRGSLTPLEAPAYECLDKFNGGK